MANVKPALGLLCRSFSAGCADRDPSTRSSSDTSDVGPMSLESSRLLRRACLSVPEITDSPDPSPFPAILDDHNGHDRAASHPVIDGLYRASPLHLGIVQPKLQELTDYLPIPAPPTPLHRTAKGDSLGAAEASGKCCITVAVRIKPCGAGELEAGAASNSFLTVDGNSITLWEMPVKTKPRSSHHFAFDAVLPPAPAPHTAAPPASQQRVFDVLGGPLLRNLVRGYNACLLCYGQTGSGKT
eukprot:EG_transcript_26515